MRHEANAGIAAAVYGKLRRQPGVVLTTLGPGAANLMLPMANAYLDQEPLLAISAQIPDDFPASHTHQLLPLHETYRPIARYVEKITGSNVLDVVPRALARCMERPFGVSYLTLSAREALKPAATGAARPVATTPRSSAGAREQAAKLRVRAAELEAPAGRDWARRRSGERGADPALADGVESAGRRDAEGQGDRRRDLRQLRRRRRRDGGRRRRCATRLPRRIWSSASASIRWKSTRRGTPNCRFTGCSNRQMPAASCRRAPRSSATARSSTRSSTSGRRRRGRSRSGSFRTSGCGC